MQCDGLVFLWCGVLYYYYFKRANINSMVMKNHAEGGQNNHDIHAHPPGSYVDIESLAKGTKTKLSVRCTLQEDGTVHMVGDAGIVENLKKGFEAPFFGEPRFVTPSDGVVFLLGLQVQFESAYVVVSDIKHPNVE